MILLFRLIVAVAVFFVTVFISMRGFSKYQDGSESPFSARVAVFFGFTAASLALHPSSPPWKAKDRTRRPFPVFMYLLAFFFNLLVSVMIIYTGDPAYAIIAVFFTVFVTSENASRTQHEVVCLVPFLLALGTVLLFSNEEIGKSVPDTMANWYGFDLAPADYTGSFMTGEDTFFINEYIVGLLVFIAAMFPLVFARSQYAINNPVNVALDPEYNGVENLARYITERKLVGLK